MSRAAYFPSDDPVARWLVSVRLCLLAVGLAAELLGLTLAFNSPTAFAGDPWWLQLTARAPTLIRIAIAFSAALSVLLAPRLKATLEDAREAVAKYRWWPWLVVHLLAFGALCLAIAATFGTAAGGELSGGRLAFCAGLGIVTGSSWFLALAPLRYWSGFLVRERLALTAAIGAGVAAWLAVKIAELYWEPLASGAVFLAEHLLQLAYPDVVSDPTEHVFGTPTFAIRILPQCSGYEGIGLVTAFLALYLWLFRGRIRFPQAFLLFPIGALAIWLANVLRIAGLVAIGTSYSPQLAMGGFHSQAGWMSFSGLALGFIFITHRTHFFAAVPAQDHAAEKINPVAAALLVPFLVLMASMTVTAVFSSGFDLWYPLRMGATAAALMLFRRAYRQWDWSWSWPSVGIGGAVFVVWMLLERFTPGDKSTLGADIAGLSQVAAVGWISFRVIGSVLIVPLVEEMAFRGYLLRRLAAADFESMEASRFTWMSFLLSSTAFGLLHGRWLAGMVAGMGYALAVYQRGKLGDAVIAHMTTNGLIASSVLITGAWSLWS
jgi:exosortase E/protease (VPEID-CTERM system)